MMRRDLAWALAAFAAIMIVLAIASWFGWEHWNADWRD